MNIAKLYARAFRAPFLTLCTVLTAGTISQAQVFTNANNDLILGFRKNSPYTENNEAVVNIGQASSYFNLAAGTTVAVPGFNPSQLTNGTFANLNNLSWSVVGAYVGTNYSGYVNNTLWLTVPRTNNAQRSLDAQRLGGTTQQATKNKIVAITAVNGGAGFISKDLGISNQWNTVSFVRESLSTYGTHTLSVFMKGTLDATQGTLNDTWPPTEPNDGNLEITTPGAFTSGSVRSDLYEVRPSSVVDPHTGNSTAAWYIGYFEFFANGTMTFTRQNATVTTTPTPVALSISRTGTTTTISFPSTTGVTYKLYYASSANLPFASWSSQPATISGDGSTKSFTDTTTDARRFYRVFEQ